MTYSFEIIKGIHVGLIIERELKKQGLMLEQFSISIGVDVAVIADTINGNTDIDFALASIIEKTLKMDDGFLLNSSPFTILNKRKKNRQISISLIFQNSDRRYSGIPGSKTSTGTGNKNPLLAEYLNAVIFQRKKS